MKKSDFRPAREHIDALPAERRAKIEAGARKLIAASHLAELRKALDVTQAAVAERSGIKQAEVSRIERAPETVQLRTMERYVESLGGSLKLVADFPDGTRAEIGMRHGKPMKSRVSAVAPARELDVTVTANSSEVEAAMNAVALELEWEDSESAGYVEAVSEDVRQRA